MSEGVVLINHSDFFDTLRIPYGRQEIAVSVDIQTYSLYLRLRNYY